MIFLVFLRSLFVNTFLNEKNLQNLGMAYALSTVLKRTSRTAEEYFARIRKYFEYFYSNSFFITAIIGLCVDLEGKGKDGAMISKIKTEAMAPVAALSDSLIWGTLKPFLTLVFGGLAFIGFKEAAIVFWVFFFGLTTYFRVWNLLMSVKLGLSFVYRLLRLNLQGLISFMKLMLVMWFGGVAVLLLALNMDLSHGFKTDPTAVFLLVFFAVNSLLAGKLRTVLSFAIFLASFSAFYLIKGTV